MTAPEPTPRTAAGRALLGAIQGEPKPSTRLSMILAIEAEAAAGLREALEAIKVLAVKHYDILILARCEEALSALLHGAIRAGAYSDRPDTRVGGVLPSPALAAPSSPALDVERLAAVEHEQWIEWSQTLAREGLTPERVARWERYWVPYADLDEPTKEHDRKWARKAIAAAYQQKGEKP